MPDFDFPGPLLLKHASIATALGRGMNSSDLLEIAQADAFLAKIGAPLASDMIVTLGKLKAMDLAGVKPVHFSRTLEKVYSEINAVLPG